MGDRFQRLVAPDIAVSQAKAAGARMLEWLVIEDIVTAEEKDCVFGDAGHPPGSQYVKATGTADPHLLSTWNNGLVVITKRTVFHSGQGGFELICTACGSKFKPPHGWGDAVGEWFNQTGPGNLACHVCGASRPIDKWQHAPPWAFGELGFEFWNWPPLTETFITEFERRLASRIVHVYGKL